MPPQKPPGDKPDPKAPSLTPGVVTARADPLPSPPPDPPAPDPPAAADPPKRQPRHPVCPDCGTRLDLYEEPNLNPHKQGQAFCPKEGRRVALPEV